MCSFYKVICKCCRVWLTWNPVTTFNTTLSGSRADRELSDCILGNLNKRSALHYSDTLKANMTAYIYRSLILSLKLFFKQICPDWGQNWSNIPHGKFDITRLHKLHPLDTVLRACFINAIGFSLIKRCFVWDN